MLRSTGQFRRRHGSGFRRSCLLAMAAELAPLPRSLTTALLELARAFEQKNVSYALIGGVATAFRSRPRFTRDLDFLLEVPQLTLPLLLAELTQRGFTFEPATVIRQWNQEHLTTLTFQGVRIDWLKPVLSCYRHIIDHAMPEQLSGSMVRIASAEGLILLKLIAFRDQDQSDIRNLLAANRGRLDLASIRQDWQSVADLSDPRMMRFEQWVKQYYDAAPGD